MGLFGLFGGGDKGAKQANSLLAQQRAELPGYFNPYIQRGERAGNALEPQYQQLLNDPSAVQQMLGAQYQQSPGYDFQYNQAMNAANQAAAAGGYLGTSAHQMQAGQTATGLANQDYWNYYNANRDLFGEGLQGTQGFYDKGYDASGQLATNMGNTYGSQANLAYTRGQNKDNLMGSLLGAGIGAAGYALGGPLGGMAAKGISNWFKPRAGA